jgi:hypothetical protein
MPHRLGETIRIHNKVIPSAQRLYSPCWLSHLAPRVFPVMAPRVFPVMARRVRATHNGTASKQMSRFVVPFTASAIPHPTSMFNRTINIPNTNQFPSSRRTRRCPSDQRRPHPPVTRLKFDHLRLQRQKIPGAVTRQIVMDDALTGHHRFDRIPRNLRRHRPNHGLSRVRDLPKRLPRINSATICW